MSSLVVKETNLDSLNLINRGKVRDIYDLGSGFLIISTDRLSAFDVILPNPIPDKGKVLNKLSLFWMKKMEQICPNHIITADVNAYPDECRQFASVLEGRSVFVKKAEVFPVECVARGYIIGSGWKDYQRTSAVCGIRLPTGLQQAQKLPEPIFTPSTKAEIGSHDENISFQQAINIVGAETANWLRDTTLELYLFGSKWAEERGIIIADTKFEFGLIAGRRTLIDEVLTPDSSRFWPTLDYRIGVSPPSLDKQFVRDYLEELDWDKTPPAPELPQEIVQKTSDNYRRIYEILAGAKL